MNASETRRRDFLKVFGLCAANMSLSSHALRSAQTPRYSTESPLIENFGLLECANPKLTEAFARSRSGISACTVGGQTHCPDAGKKWGLISVLNDLYFGLYGGLFAGGKHQHQVFRQELRKIARHYQPSRDRTPLPWSVSEDGFKTWFNPDGGMDLDRCAQFVLEVVRTYEATGDREFALELHPVCVKVVNYLDSRDFDGDNLPEGRTDPLALPLVKGNCGCASVSYIGDTAANAWKDFGAALFYYEAMRHLGQMESCLGMDKEATRHFERAEIVLNRIRETFWSQETGGFLAWIDKDGTPHKDWITGNNLHAVASGIADAQQTAQIMGTLEQHRKEIEEIVPCRVRIGIFAEGLCTNRPEDYWNGGIWPLVAAPDMLARVSTGDLDGALRVAEILATRVDVTEVGFYEAYDGKTGEPNDCRGLLMNNGGFIWGVIEGIMGIKLQGDALLIRDTVPSKILPAKARIHYRGSDFEITWKQNFGKPSARLNGKEVPLQRNHFYLLKLKPKPGQTYQLQIDV